MSGRNKCEDKTPLKMLNRLVVLGLIKTSNLAGLMKGWRKTA